MRFYGRLQKSIDEVNQTIKINEGFEQFQNFNIAKNLTESTIKHYQMCFDIFAEFYDVAQPCYSLTQDTIFAYIAYLKVKRNINEITLNTYLRSIRVLFYYFMEHGYTQPFQISLMKTTKQIKHSYTDYELDILLKKPQISKATFCEYRNWVLVNYLLATANREATVSNLKIGDVDFDNDVIHLRKTKNRREQIIPLSRSLGKVLKEYLRYREGGTDDYLFCSVTGERLTENALKLAVNKYNKKRGVMKTSVHLFRHTFAKNWIKNGGDPFRLQKILGHSSMDMVKEYVEMFCEDLKEDFDNFNPLEKFHKNSASREHKVNAPKNVRKFKAPHL